MSGTEIDHLLNVNSPSKIEPRLVLASTLTLQNYFIVMPRRTSLNKLSSYRLCLFMNRGSATVLRAEFRQIDLDVTKNRFDTSRFFVRPFKILSY